MKFSRLFCVGGRGKAIKFGNQFAFLLTAQTLYLPSYTTQIFTETRCSSVSSKVFRPASDSLKWDWYFVIEAPRLWAIKEIDHIWNEIVMDNHIVIPVFFWRAIVKSYQYILAPENDGLDSFPLYSGKYLIIPCTLVNRWLLLISVGFYCSAPEQFYSVCFLPWPC